MVFPSELARDKQYEQDVIEALLRVPVMTMNQIRRFVGSATPQWAYLKRRWEHVEPRPYKGRVHYSEDYGGFKALRQYYVLSEGADEGEELREWAQSEEMALHLDGVRADRLVRTLLLMEILVSLRRTGTWFGDGGVWDLSISGGGDNRVHAKIDHRDGFKVGVYLLPRQYGSKRRYLSIRGVVRKIMQHAGETHDCVLFLIPREHYEMALTATIHKSAAGVDEQKIALLPWESFIREPDTYLRAILQGEAETEAWALAHDPSKSEWVESNRYRVDGHEYAVGAYTSGRISAMKNLGYQSVDDFRSRELGRDSVLERLYVYDSTMAAALTQLAAKRFKSKKLTGSPHTVVVPVSVTRQDVKDEENKARASVYTADDWLREQPRQHRKRASKSLPKSSQKTTTRSAPLSYDQESNRSEWDEEGDL
ncbi:MAG: hypothetical protein ACYCYO_00300 [Bacilli bacterium]